jgi:tryptophan halogenase
MKKVVIIGGGTAGWATALSVQKFWKDIDVTLIESSKIGILGAGEGGTTNFGLFLNLLDIDVKDFLEKTGSTTKDGIKLLNWTYNGSESEHLFHQTSKYTNDIRRYSAFHFDARKVSEYLKRIALDRGINWIDGEVSKINNSAENIDSIELNNGTIIDLDFIFDCSGFARLIINGVHKENWNDYSKYLLINKALGYFLPQTKSLSNKDLTHTYMHSMSSGWMFQIPLQHRWGCGYAFNENYITPAEAKKEIEEYLGHEIQVQKVFDFKAGTFERSWIGNSIAIGLSYGFLEPLEATSLMSTIIQLKRLIDNNFDVSYRDTFNRICKETNEQNMMFVRYHYLNERLDTPFWKDAYNAPIPEKLKSILDGDNKITITNNTDLLKVYELEHWEEDKLTFQVYNYDMVYKKNKKGIYKTVI